MRSSTVSTRPPRVRTSMAPSPSTRASASTRRVRLPSALWVMAFALPPERLGVGVEGAEGALDLLVVHAEALQPAGERAGVRGLLGAEAAVAAAVVGGAQRAAAGVGDRPQAGRAVGDHHADVAGQLALHADAVPGHPWPAPLQERGDHLEELAAVDGAAAQLEVDRDVVADRSGVLQRRDVLRAGVDDRHELADVGEVAQ